MRCVFTEKLTLSPGDKVPVLHETKPKLNCRPSALATFAHMTPVNEIEQLRDASAARLAGYKKKMRLFTLLRLGIFAVFAAVVWATWWSGVTSGLLIATGIALFLRAVYLHGNVREARDSERAYFALCEEELKSQAEGTAHRPDGADYIDPAHPFTSDLNIFGAHSIFQLLNRTQTAEGEQHLAAALQEVLTDREAIEAEREMITEFAADPDWALRYLAHKRRAAARTEQEGRKKKTAPMPPVNLPDSAAARFLLTRLAPAVMLAITATYAFSYLTWNTYLLCLAASGILTGIFLKRTTLAFAEATDRAADAGAAEAVTAMLRTREFTSSAFRKKAEDAAFGESETAYRSLRKISGAIDSRNNIIVGIALNLLLFWDLQCAYRLSDWQKKYAVLFPGWQDLTAEIEKYLSFGMYRYTRPEAADPEITDTDDFILKGARHPLLGEEAVPNSVDLNPPLKFAIVTGANMAGKSTYLRTAGVLAVMAMRGLPVTAEAMRFTPVRIYTSMLTADSLGDAASFFFSELRRLRAIADALETGQPHLIILDEILKGTNSADKAEGSKLFLRKLLRLPAKGLIATHDLSLCTAEEAHPGEIANLSFEMDFADGKPVFDYTLRDGVCQNMNAAFLLREMGLTT